MWISASTWIAVLHVGRSGHKYVIHPILTKMALARICLLPSATTTRRATLANRVAFPACDACTTIITYQTLVEAAFVRLGA
jgi:hypothetical protein